MRVIERRRSFELKEWGCPRTKSRSNWCHAHCVPHEGLGDCGRLAPHAMLGRTQLAILAHRRRAETPEVEGAEERVGPEMLEEAR